MEHNHIYIDDNGIARDRIVERMFYDIDTGKWEEDGITESNFKTYCQIIYGAEPKLPFATSHCFELQHITAFAASVFDAMVIINRQRIEKQVDNGKIYGCRNHRWGDTTMYAQHADLNIAIALAVVQDMRFQIIMRFSAGETKQ